MKLKRVGGILVLLLTGVLFSASPVMADSPTVTEVSNQLICQCGCTLILNNCTHVECMSREGMTAVIQQKIDQGQSADEIVQYFVAQYGEQVLASPPKKGFNLVAWLLPFAAILSGGGVIAIVLKKWVWQGTQSPDAVPTEIDDDDKKYQSRLEKELEGFSGRGFR